VNITPLETQAPLPEPLLHSYPEARALLGGIPQSTFAMWIAQGIIVPVKIGPRRAFIRHSDILRLSQEGAQVAP
jgi:hypothetical protein